MATHNGVRWPRIAHHATHVAAGLPVWLATRQLQLVDRLPVAELLALVIAIAIKCIWLDLPDRRIVWTGTPDDIDWWDFAADWGFTILGATLPVWWLGLPAYYLLSIFSDP